MPSCHLRSKQPRRNSQELLAHQKHVQGHPPGLKDDAILPKIWIVLLPMEKVLGPDSRGMWMRFIGLSVDKYSSGYAFDENMERSSWRWEYLLGFYFVVRYSKAKRI